MKNKNNKQNQQNERDDKIVLEGVVDEALPGTLFKVKTSGGAIVLATLSGKMRMNKIRVLPGDNVMVEVSPYDVTRGRISWRGK